MEKIPVGVLAATGIVGQRFIQLLADHPWFEVAAVAASERSAGKRYADAVHWLLPTPIPERIADMTVVESRPPLDCALVFSALPSDVAREVEPAFAEAGYVVSSNASAYRREPDVPLLIPEVNPDHLGLLPSQQKSRGWDHGCLVTNPNCSTITLVMALKPLVDAFGVEQVIVTTMQATSGAGYPGVPSLDVIDNVLPHTDGEEPKMEWEPLKLLGSLNGAEDHAGGLADQRPLPSSGGMGWAHGGRLGQARSPGDGRRATAGVARLSGLAARAGAAECAGAALGGTGAGETARSRASTGTQPAAWRRRWAEFGRARSSTGSCSWSATIPSAALREPPSSTPN